jgi:hypothetical protein
LWATISAAIVLSLVSLGGGRSGDGDAAPVGLLLLTALLGLVGASFIAVIAWRAAEWSPAFLGLGCIGMAEAALLRGLMAQGWAPGGTGTALEAVNAAGMLAGGLWFAIGVRPHWPTGPRSARRVRLVFATAAAGTALVIMLAASFPAVLAATAGMAIAVAAASAGYVLAAFSFAAAHRFLRLPSQLSMAAGSGALALSGIVAVQPFVPVTTATAELLGLAASALPPLGFILEQRSRPGLRTMVLSLFMSGAAENLERGHTEGVSRLLERAAEFDGPLAGHLERVARLSVQLGLQLGLGPAELRSVAQAARLHDIGKIIVPRHILNAPGRLTGAEWEVMKSHAVEGERIVARLPAVVHAACAVGEHHERWDGTGYPRHTAGSDISLAGRIIAVADVFDALCSVRSYKQAWNEADAMAEVRRGSGTHFDPSVVAALEAVVRRSPASRAA